MSMTMVCSSCHYTGDDFYDVGEVMKRLYDTGKKELPPCETNPVMDYQYASVIGCPRCGTLFLDADDLRRNNEEIEQIKSGKTKT